MIAALALAAFVIQAVGQVSPAETLSPLEPALETRVQALAKSLRCAVCQGVSIADSPASMAQAQLETVRALVREGKTDEEVREYFIARYGEWVLLEPPRHGFNWVVWLAPLAALVLGAYLVAKTIRPRVSAAKATPPTPPPTPTAPAADEDPYLRRVREELER